MRRYGELRVYINKGGVELQLSVREHLASEGNENYTAAT